mmetsp:Transcript_102603/g.296660  ORF Transcript_102603/g.296660 Transcript_102603/m.296660 type:complete len:725 (+) Transcript_102603:71-2245(+)
MRVAARRGPALPGAGYPMAAVCEGPQGTPRMSDFLRGISLQYSCDELDRATHGWNASRKLGSGSYGSVYKGELEDGSEVAVKVIDLKAVGAQGQDPEMAGFEDEVKTLSKFRHPNLVTLLGWGKQAHYRYLIYELLSGGDAFQRVHLSKTSKGAKPFQWYERVSVLLDAATGLSHMHNSRPKAFHRDIKAANILLDRHGTAKMADFGLSCTASQCPDGKDHRHVDVKVVSGTPGYACPIYAKTGRVTEASEVYSFGMVMLELMTGIPPAMSARNGGIVYPIANTIAPRSPGALERTMQNVDAHANFPSALLSELAALALRCADPVNDQTRPRFVEVVRALRSLAERFPKPGLDPDMLGLRGISMDGSTLSGGCSPQSVEAARIAGSTASSSSSPAGASAGEAPYYLEVVAAEGFDVAAFPTSFRRLQLSSFAGDGFSPSSPGSLMVAPVGRQHQPEFFEAWLPDPQLLQCVSRTAFNLVWLAGSSPGTATAPRLVPRGANDIAVNGQVPARTPEGTTLAPGVEIGFPYKATEGGLVFFLRLRLLQVDSDASSAAASLVAVGDTAPLPRFASDRSLPQAPRAAGPASWTLRCVHAEGATQEELVALGPEFCDLLVSEADPVPLAVGRQHQQRRFDALLAKSLPCMSFISRTHMRVEAQRNAVQVTNLSQNPVYIDREPLAKGEVRQLSRGQVLSFARLEGTSHVLFLSFAVCSGEHPLQDTPEEA